jgi:hypothetical protein
MVDGLPSICKPLEVQSLIPKKSSELVTHACNPNYSGGRDQGDQGLTSVQANSS